MHFFKRGIESVSTFRKHFVKHQVDWIMAEQPLHEQGKQAIALAEKSIRIGWTYADAFKNVRKRLLFKNRDYLFATKDYPSAIEYVVQCYKFAEIFNLTKFITFHDITDMEVNRLDERGKPSALTDKVKVGMVKFDNGSRIIAFSASPQSMAVHGGDVGLDEFAKHPNARLLWETAQGRVALGGDLAIYSAHDGEDTLFNEFAQEARAACNSGLLVPVSPGHWRLNGASPSEIKTQPSKITNPEHGVPASAGPPSAGSEIQNNAGTPARPLTDSSTQPRTSPWNLYFRVTMEDAISNGFIKTLNRANGTKLNRETFLADCRTRAREESIFQQCYMCNPAGAASFNSANAGSHSQRLHFDGRRAGPLYV